ncbi:MAG: ORF6N domain-containing protein [Candidatus Omnitrophota bacterium]
MKNRPLNMHTIASAIYRVRGRKVMLDRDLAMLYGVSTKYLKRQVRRNFNRFPSDFMFELSREETQNWRCQFGTSNSKDKMGLRYSPFAFTEHGILMLSSVLNSEKAARVNIAIMRIFLHLRQMALSHKDLTIRLEKIDRTVENHEKKIKQILTLVTKYFRSERKPKRQIGFHT